MGHRPDRQDLGLFAFAVFYFPIIVAVSSDEVRKWLAFSVSLLGFVSTTILSLERKKSKSKRGGGTVLPVAQISREDLEKQKQKKKETWRTILFFGIVYSTVAGGVFVTALESVRSLFLEAIRGVYEPSLFGTSLVLVGFLAEGVVFYHCGILFLSSTAAEKLTGRKASRVFPDFVLLFGEIGVIYYMATSLGSLATFSSLLAILAILDITWVLYFYFTTDDPNVFFEWIHLDLLTFLFALVLLRSSINWFSYVSLTTVLVIGSICDYIFAWDFYSRTTPGG